MTPTAAVTAQSPAEPARKAEIAKKLSPRCGQPTKWTPAQKRAVAATIEKGADDPGMDLLAAEWDRVNNAIRICRGEKL